MSSDSSEEFSSESSSDAFSEEEAFSSASESEDESEEAFSPVPAAAKATPKKKAAAKKTASPKQAKNGTAAKTKKAPAAKKEPAAKKAPAAGKKAKVAVLGEKDGAALITDYITKQNRPYSHTQVFDNLHGQVKKAMVPRILKQLADDSKIVVKAFKKTLLYSANQENFPDVSPEELNEKDVALKALQAEISENKKTIHQLESEVNALEASMTNKELAEALKEAEEKATTLQSRLEALRDGGGVKVDAAEIKKAQDGYNAMFKHWQTRKRYTRDIVGMICEGSGEHPTKFQKTLDIETDEDAGLDYSKYLKMSKLGSKR